jgi:hypothetical protein
MSARIQFEKWERPFLACSQRYFIVGLTSVLLFAATSVYCSDYSKYPEPLRSRRDIAHASADTDNIFIAKLPIEDYPALTKFTKLKRVDFHTQDGVGADDQKLLTLSRIGFTNLFDIDLLNCPRVTDAGISHLVQLPALRYLQLEGTSISDPGCKVLAMKQSVTGVNVANCTNVTLSGLTELAHSQTLDEFSFSSDRLTQDDLVRLIGELRHVTWCEIDDPKGEIDAVTIKKTGETKGVKIVLQAVGALQTLRGEEWRPWTSKNSASRNN